VQGSVLRQTVSYYGEREILKSVAKAGERWHFRIEEEELWLFLKEYDLSVSEHKDAQGLEQMYFTDAAGKIVGRINGTHCMVRAVKIIGDRKLMSDPIHPNGDGYKIMAQRFLEAMLP
jgi:lysophospholipase L1-like esterase